MHFQLAFYFTIGDVIKGMMGLENVGGRINGLSLSMLMLIINGLGVAIIYIQQ